MPFALAASLLNLITGLIFLIGHPEQYVHNRRVVAEGRLPRARRPQCALFETMPSDRGAGALGAGEDTPPAAKVIGAISLVAWLGVLYWGRMLPFIGDAY